MKKAHSKHNVYVGKYKIDDNSVAIITEDSYWRVLMHLEEGHFVESNTEGGQIALILSEDANSFWPIISFLDDDEARELANEQLDKLER